MTLITPDPQQQRLPTVRQTLKHQSSSTALEAAHEMLQRTMHMNTRAQKGEPLTKAEIQDVIHSIQNTNPQDNKLDYAKLAQLLQQVAHLSHKDWSVTEQNAEKLAQILFNNKGMSCLFARQLLERVVREGNWDGAAQHAQSTNTKPFAVLVTGVNGIRKTSSLYQPWFPKLLAEALVAPPNAPTNFAPTDLPSGSNSFFRQLDHIIATLCNEDFATLYRLTYDQLGPDQTKDPPPELVQAYSDLKAAIFTRYRTLSELLGAILLKEAQGMNCMMETSGRDVAMFHYVDHFFPQGYHKLALHFVMNDLRHAQTSVDARMKHEIQLGMNAIFKGNTFDVIHANQGGPYGSQVLPGIQTESDRVWNQDVMKNQVVGQDWYKATIMIHGHDTEPWTAQAVRPDGSLGTVYEFGPRS